MSGNVIQQIRKSRLCLKLITYQFLCVVGPSEDGTQLDLASREWACKAYCVSAAIDNLSAKVTAKVTDQEVKSYQWEDSTQTQKILRQRTEDLVRLKGLLVSVVQRYICMFCP